MNIHAATPRLSIFHPSIVGQVGTRAAKHKDGLIHGGTAYLSGRFHNRSDSNGF
jgi:hypothetical protein